MSNEQGLTPLSDDELKAQAGTALPDKEVASVLDLNADLDLGINAAAPIDLAVAANANVAAPIDAAASANVLSFGSESQALADQGVIIDQGITARRHGRLHPGQHHQPGHRRRNRRRSMPHGGTADAAGTAPLHRDRSSTPALSRTARPGDCPTRGSMPFPAGPSGRGGRRPSRGSGPALDGDLLNVNVDLDADADIAAPINGAVAANANVAAPIDAAVAPTSAPSTAMPSPWPSRTPSSPRTSTATPPPRPTSSPT